MRTRKKDIAIIGISGKFPKSDDIYEFWDNISKGEELIHFYEDKELINSSNSNDIESTNFVKAKSFLNNKGSFDYTFFGYTKEEASLMDPQIRIMHEQVWSALEDGGYNPNTYENKIGLYLSAGDNFNWRAHVMMNPNDQVNPFFIEQISNVKFISTLISYSLNLKGPSYVLDTACSSSLSNIHIACRNLLLKECSMALAGGIRTSSSTEKGYFYKQGLIYSKDGHCRAFDKDASGTINGEGAGVVLLKRLEDAINDRDYIYGVIRGTATNNDGKRKVGYTAPSAIGQYECIKLAQRIASVSPNEISYVEAHGTGTKLGDPIEVEALNKAFDFNNNHSCALGSLKTNIGHLDAAAGIASFIKVVLSLKNKKIPPTLHFKAANENIEFNSGPFYVNTKLKDWETEEKEKRIAGVSSFGIGGTNAHVIIEEAPEVNSENSLNDYHLIPYAAKTKSSLLNYEVSLKKFIEESKDVSIADLAFTLQAKLKSYPFRKFIVCKDKESAVNKLKSKSDQKTKASEISNIIFMFPGQGNQYLGMCKELYEKETFFRSIVDTGLDLLEGKSGDNYKEILGFNINGLVDKSKINNTRYSQPLLFIIEYAIAKLLMYYGIEPNAIIGHSLGEYVGACIAGVFSFEDGLRLVDKRAQLMSGLAEGEMLNIGETAKRIKHLLNESLNTAVANLDIAVINTDNSCVVSGEKEIINVFKKLLIEKNILFTTLKTSHAFHSKMMDSILGDFSDELKFVNLSEPVIPILSNISGVNLLPEEAKSTEYWTRHLRETVNFVKGASFLLDKQNSLFIEIGPGNSLTTFLSSHAKFNTNHKTVNLVRKIKDIKNDYECFINGIGAIWNCGVNVKWDVVYSNEMRNRIPVPLYNFDKNIFPAEVSPYNQLSKLNIINKQEDSHEDYINWCYKEGWKEIKTDFSKVVVESFKLYFLGEDVISKIVEAKIRKCKEEFFIVKAGKEFIKHSDNLITINPKRIEDYQKLETILSNKTLSTKLSITHIWNIEKNDTIIKANELGYFSLLNISKTILNQKKFKKVHIDFVASSVFKVFGQEEIEPAKSMAIAALKVIPKEFQNVDFRFVEFSNLLIHTDTSFILEVLSSDLKNEFISIRGNKLWEPFFINSKLTKNQIDNNQLKQNGTYLVTGGNGGIAKTVSHYLENSYNANIILIVRRCIDFENEQWIKKKGSKVKFIVDDLSEKEVLTEKINSALADWGKSIDGVFHTAGIMDTAGLIITRKQEDCEKVFMPKVNGTENICEAISSYEPDFIVFFSSLAAVLAPFGQVSYAAANMFQNYYAKSKDKTQTRFISIMWDAWTEVGMAVNASNHYNADITSIQGISNYLGTAILIDILNQKRAQEVIVSISDFNSLIKEKKEDTLYKYLLKGKDETDLGEPKREKPRTENSYLKPSTEIEIALCNMLELFFGFESIGIHDDFFELGGDSLKAMVLIKKIEKEFDYEFTLNSFFENSTIQQLAKEISIAKGINDLRSDGSTNDNNKILI